MQSLRLIGLELAAIAAATGANGECRTLSPGDYPNLGGATI
jgi:hypothetical protein